MLRWLDGSGASGNIPRWEATDWALFLGITGVTAGLMLPTGPSADVRIDRWITHNLDSWVPDIYSLRNQVIVMGGLGLVGATMWGVALVRGDDRTAEAVSLIAEAVTVVQLFHVSSKLLIGREGPQNGEGLGRVLGPAASPRLYPAGTPSGHFASLYAVVAVAEAYWEPHWAVSAAVHLVAGSLALMHVVNHRHFLSEILVGAGMGYATGNWVVRHRSSLYRSSPGGSLRLRPVLTGDGIGLQLRF